MAIRIKQTAATPGELAVAELYHVTPEIVGDFRLAGLPFETESIEQITLGVCLRGTTSQKAALIRHLPMETGFAFPECAALFRGDLHRWETGLMFLSANIERLAAYFGGPLPADIRETSERLLENFGGLTPVDWVRFFDMCRDGKFRSEFQNVSVRGVTSEFLTDWLNQYCEKRELVYLQLNKDAAANAAASDPGGQPTPKPAHVIQRAAELAQLEYAAQQYRVEWENDLTETAVLEYWSKLVWVETVIAGESGFDRTEKRPVMVPCKSDDPDRKEKEVSPFRRDKPAASYKRLHLFVSNFITIGDHAETFIDQMVDEWKVQHESIGTGIEFKEYARAQSKAFVSNGMRLIDSVAPGELIRRALGKRDNRPGFEYTDQSRRVCDMISDAWPEYLRQCLDADIYPLKKNHYITQQVLVWLRDNGLGSGRIDI